MFKKFLHDESGATAVEYALLAGLITVSILTSLSLIGNKLGNDFNNVSAQLK